MASAYRASAELDPANAMLRWPVARPVGCT
jgi:hypothetical protein